MSKNLFTPGPWKTDFKMHAQFEKNSHVHLLTDSEGFNIGLLSSWVDDPATRAEASANARLIAAAPELYEALTAVLKYTGIKGIVLGTDPHAAIAKARGEA